MRIDQIHFIWHIMDFMAFFVSLHRISSSLKERQPILLNKNPLPACRNLLLFQVSYCKNPICYVLIEEIATFPICLYSFPIKTGNNSPAHPPNMICRWVRKEKCPQNPLSERQAGQICTSLTYRLFSRSSSIDCTNDRQIRIVNHLVIQGVQVDACGLF